MFNVVINNEQYDEYLAQKEKIKELEARNEFLRGKFDDLYEENVNRIKKCDTLEEQVNHWKMQFESTYENYQQALSEKVALIKERDRITNVVHKQGSDIVSLRAKIDEAKNKDIRFKELVTENYRLRMSINDLKENNKALKKENKDLTELNEKQYYTISNLSDKNDKLEAEKKELKDIIAKNTARHNEMLFEKDKLVNRLHDYESQIAELAERNVTIIENQYNEYRCDCPFCNNNDI